MEMTRNVIHGFDLTGLKTGDTFLGCPLCWWRLNPGEAAKPVCPHCMATLAQFTVTPDDFPQESDERCSRALAALDKIANYTFEDEARFGSPGDFAKAAINMIFNVPPTISNPCPNIGGE